MRAEKVSSAWSGASRRAPRVTGWRAGDDVEAENYSSGSIATDSQFAVTTVDPGSGGKQDGARVPVPGCPCTGPGGSSFGQCDGERPHSGRYERGGEGCGDLRDRAAGFRGDALGIALDRDAPFAVDAIEIDLGRCPGGERATRGTTGRGRLEGSVAIPIGFPCASVDAIGDDANGVTSGPVPDVERRAEFAGRSDRRSDSRSSSLAETTFVIVNVSTTNQADGSVHALAIRVAAGAAVFLVVVWCDVGLVEACGRLAVAGDAHSLVVDFVDVAGM